MAGFKNGSLSLKRRDTSASSDLGYSHLNFSTDNVAYIVDETGTKYSVTPFSTGAVNLPIETRLGNSVYIPSFEINIYDNPNHSGVLHRKTVQESILPIADGGIDQYVIVSWNSGNPILSITSNSKIINQSNIIACYLFWNVNNDIHGIRFDNKGSGLSNKIDQMLISTMPYKRTLDGGLIISEDSSRNIIVTSAVVYAGTTPYNIFHYNSITDYITEVYHSSGIWIYNKTSGSYNNLLYDNGTNLVTMDNNKFSVRWIYRSIGDTKEIFLVYGQNQYNNSETAKLETIPSVPNIVLHHCMLVGRIIIQKGASSGIVETAFSDFLTTGGVSNHNDLLNLQGGNSSLQEFYHLSANTYNYLLTVSANIQNQLSALSASKVSTNRIISATSGLTGGGSLSENISIGLSLTGTSGTYTKINTDIYGRVISGGFLTSSDIPNLGAIRITPSKFLITIPSNVWTINHGLDRYPNFSTRITTTGYEGYRLEPTVLYNDENTMTLTWSQNFTGAVHLI